MTEQPPKQRARIASLCNLAAAATWLALSGLTCGVCILSFMAAVPTVKIENFIPAAISIIPAFLWLLLSLDGLIRPRVLRTGRWYMIGIAITLVALGWSTWLHEIPAWGTLATLLACASLICNLRTIPPTPHHSDNA